MLLCFLCQPAQVKVIMVLGCVVYFVTDACWQVSAADGMLLMLRGQPAAILLLATSQISDQGCCPTFHLTFHHNRNDRLFSAFVRKRAVMIMQILAMQRQCGYVMIIMM
jgi:hypothetical protein